MKNRMSGLSVIVLAVVLVGGCATSSGAKGADGARESEEPADCVISDPQGSEVQIRQCYVETGPKGMPENVRIPIVETTTQVGDVEFTYPLKFEMRVTDKGRIRIVGPIRRAESEEEPEESPDQAPEIGEENGESEMTEESEASGDSEK